VSHLRSSSSASIGALSLASIVVIFLAVSVRPAATATEPLRVDVHVGFGTANPLRFEPTDRNPSVPAASSVSFPAGDADDRAIETF
jgi:hypothetical protein